MTWDGEDRRQPVRLHEDDRAMLSRIIFILEDKNVGLCGTVKKHHEAIYGNGGWGIKTHVLFVYASICLLCITLGADHPWVLKLISRLGGIK